MNNSSASPRKFLHTTGFGAGVVFGFPAIVRGQDLNSRIRVACIGVGGKGRSDVNNVAKCGCDIVGLCDVDGNPQKGFQPLRPYPDLTKEIVNLQGKMPKSGCLVVGSKGNLY